MSGAYYPSYLPPLPPGATLDPYQEPGAPTATALPPLPPGGKLDPPPGMPAPEPSFAGRLVGQQPGALIPSATPDQGSILPVRRTPEGRPAFDPTAGVLGSLLRVLSTPGDVWRGRVPIWGPEGPAGGYNPDLINRAAETASTISPTNPAIRAGDRIIPGAERSARNSLAPPSATVLRDTADLGFNDVRARGPDVLSAMIADQARTTAADLGPRFARESAPKTYGLLDAMQDPARSWTSMTDLLARRDALKDIVGGPEGAAAKQATEAIDRMIAQRLDATNTRPQYLAGPYAPMAPGEVAPALEKARGNYGAAQRSNILSGELDKATTGIVEKAEGRAASTYSGGNLDNNIRASARSLLEQNKQVGGYTEAEVAALEAIRDGTMPRNLARQIGNTLGGQGGLARLWSSGLGGAVGTLLFGDPKTGAAIGAVAAPAIGSMFRGAANAAAKRSVEAADDLLRSRAPLYSDMQAAGRFVPQQAFTRDELITRSLVPGLLQSERLPHTRLSIDEDEYQRGLRKRGIIPQGPVI